MERDDPPTCGKGLAAGAALPTKLAELTDARAEVLERHMKALDLSDANSRLERDAYERLAQAHRDIARRLTGLAQQMAACRDLPMGRHDPAVMADSKGQIEAFGRFVRIERELLDLLSTELEAQEKMLP